MNVLVSCFRGGKVIRFGPFPISTMEPHNSDHTRSECAGKGGISVRDVTTAVDVFNDGADVIQIPIAGELIDLVLAGSEAYKANNGSIVRYSNCNACWQYPETGQVADIQIISAPEQFVG